jgi:enoyl-CoA hydratase
MISTDERDGITFLTLEHGKVNALDVELLTAIETAFRELADAPPKAVVLTGAGRAFSAGVDLKRMVDEGAPYAERLLGALDGALGAMFEAPFPVVAALNGHAIAGGFVLACASDHRLLAQGGARVGVPELLVGVPWPTLALEIVRQAFAPNRAQELILFGRTYGAEDALERGLVDTLVRADELVERATGTAHELAGIPAEAFRSAKALLHRPTLDLVRRVGPERDAEVLAGWCSEATREFVRGYLERTVGTKKG